MTLGLKSGLSSNATLEKIIDTITRQVEKQEVEKQGTANKIHKILARIEKAHKPSSGNSKPAKKSEKGVTHQSPLFLPLSSDVFYSFEARVLRQNSVSVKFTPGENSVFNILFSDEQIFSQDNILDILNNYGTTESRVIGAMICKIRKKLQAFNDISIDTIPGKGWILITPERLKNIEKEQIPLCENVFFSKKLLSVKSSKKRITLSLKENSTLSLLLYHQGKSVASERFGFISSGSLKTHISKLRKKLEFVSDGELQNKIIGVTGEGYKWGE